MFDFLIIYDKDEAYALDNLNEQYKSEADNIKRIVLKKDLPLFFK